MVPAALVRDLQDHKIIRDLPDVQSTLAFGQDIALAVKPGDTVWLIGDLGAGKTELARAIIRTLCGNGGLEVPSPTFSLVQTYKFHRGEKETEILHADLHRLGDPSEIVELGLTHADTDDDILLVEWPENGGDFLRQADLKISLSEVDRGRRAEISGTEAALSRLERSLIIRDFLKTGWADGVERSFLLGDASARTYEKVRLQGDTRILMNAPRQPDGPPIRDGKPYSRIAHLAEDVSAFAGVAGILRGYGLSVPEIHAADFDEGLLLTEDFGSQGVLDSNRKPIPERYLEAAAMLAALHKEPIVSQCELPNGMTHKVPSYDREAMMIETSLLADWYAPHVLGRKLSTGEQGEFETIWNSLISTLAEAGNHIVLRDFHSPNIIWLPDRENIRRVGLIDFQDAVIGPAAYDLASLAQDARVDVSGDLEQSILDHYVKLRRKAEAGFDNGAFERDYAIMAAQRATKILGIFVRLNERDGKPAYLAHIPRIREYVRRATRHPVLADYREWLENVTGL